MQDDVGCMAKGVGLHSVSGKIPSSPVCTHIFLLDRWFLIKVTVGKTQAPDEHPTFYRHKETAHMSGCPPSDKRLYQLLEVGISHKEITKT